MFFRVWYWDWLPWSRRAHAGLGLCRHREVWICLQMGHFFLHFLQNNLCFPSRGFLLPLKQGFLCKYLLLPASRLRVRGWSCYQDSFKISLSIHFHHSKEKKLPVAESSVQQNLFSQKKIFFWQVCWFFSLSKGGSSKIICYILHSIVKGSTHCSCTLLVLSETISIPTFYLTSHLSSASNALA